MSVSRDAQVYDGLYNGSEDDLSSFSFLAIRIWWRSSWDRKTNALKAYPTEERKKEKALRFAAPQAKNLSSAKPRGDVVIQDTIE